MKTITKEYFINNYEKIVKYCNESFEPICVTVNGKPDLVALPIDYFKKQDELMRQKEKDY